MLDVADVSVTFAGVKALDCVSVSAGPAAVTGLIGPNGAGKTTLFNVITGLEKPASGKVLLDGADVTRLSPANRARRGLSRTFQRLEIFAGLSVRDNIRVAAELRKSWSREAEDPSRVADRLVNRLALEAVADTPADLLPTGQARLVEFARALAVRPRVLLLDEPSSGLSDAETDRLAELVTELAAEGCAVVLVEHDVELVMRVCRDVNVLDTGRVIAAGSPAEVRASDAVQRAYLGLDIADDAQDHNSTDGSARRPVRVGAGPVNSPQPGAEASTPSLELRAVKAGYDLIEVVHGVDLKVERGSVLALLGPNGAGKSTTIRVAAGLLKPSSGSVLLEGEDITAAPAQARVHRGICTIPEGRSVCPNLTVRENLQLWTHQGQQKLEEVAGRVFEVFPALSGRRTQLAGSLSGGEQQMLAMSRAVCSDARVLLLDELSMGLAPLIVAQLYDIVRQFVDAGMSILLVEQAAKTALGLATSAAVLSMGRIVATGTPAEIEEKAVDLYLGPNAAKGSD